MRLLLTAMLALVFIQARSQTSNIELVEFWIDSDPGYTNATSIAFTQNPNITITNYLITAPITTGIHTVGIRSRDANHKWSLTNVFPILVLNTPNTSSITYMEYWIDIDPGYGNATAFNFTPQQNVVINQVPINISGLPEGIHTVGYRSKDALGNWSLTNISPLLMVSHDASKIVAVEYFWDTDPGYQNALDSVFTIPVANLVGVNFPLHVPATLDTLVTHKLFIRTRDTLGRWSLTNHIDGISISTCSSFAISVVNNSIVICSGQTATLQANNASNYSWSPGGTLNTTTGDSVIATPTTSTTYSVTGTNGTCADTKTVAVTVNQNPSVNINASDTSVCDGASINMIASGATSYAWSNGLGSSDSVSVSPPVGSNVYSVTGTNSNNCTATATQTIMVNAIPQTPVITQTGNSLSTATTGVTYQWYLNGNILTDSTNQTIYPSANGNYTLVVTSVFGCESSASNEINVTGVGVGIVDGILLVAIYPNPFSEVVNIKSGQSGRMVITDMLGKSVFENHIQGNTSISLTGFANGMYNLQFYNMNGEIFTAKIIKQ